MEVLSSDSSNRKLLIAVRVSKLFYSIQRSQYSIRWYNSKDAIIDAQWTSAKTLLNFINYKLLNGTSSFPTALYGHPNEKVLKAKAYIQKNRKIRLIEVRYGKMQQW